MNKKFTLLLVCALIFSLDLAAQFKSLMAVKEEPITASTGERPQSKVWNYDCQHWAVFANSSGTHLWRLEGDKWNKILTLSSNNTSKADCKVAGNLTHVLLYQGAAAELVSLEYVPEASNYKLWSEKPATATIPLHKDAETATIDIDGTGRMWLAYDGFRDINVRWSDAPYTNWSEPINIASRVSVDDICAVVTLPGKIGIIWSDQTTKRFGFKTHTDGADPASWSSNEVPASETALDVGKGMANDHINMAVASDGTLYCAIKTEYRREYERLPYPLIALLIRRPSGTWDKLYDVHNRGTRPIVLLNEELNKLRVIYTNADGGGKIVYKETPTSEIAFGPQQILIDGKYNDATSIKGNHTGEVVVMASSGANVVSVLASDETMLTDVCGFEETFTAYPNPFSSITSLYFLFRTTTDYTVTLYDSKGAMIETIGTGTARAGRQTKVEINGEDLAKGLYLVKLQTASGSKALRLVYDR